METQIAIAHRRSIRTYKPEQIPKEILDNIIKAGFKAPVASGRYDSLHITVVQNPEALKQIADAAAEGILSSIQAAFLPR